VDGSATLTSSRRDEIYDPDVSSKVSRVATG
jgi:hypothetical protein